MKLRILTFLSLAMMSFASALTPNDKTTLVNGTTYKADDEGATYEITTNGADINAVIDVTANVTIVMNNCHIVATETLKGYRDAIIIVSPNKTLELLFKGENKIVANRNDTIYQYGAIALSSNAASTGGVIFAEAEKDASLYLRGKSRETGTRAPIDFYQRGFVLFRSGRITIASSPRTYGSTELIPSLAKAETISLRGGTLIAQMTSPFLASELAKTDLIGSKLLNVENTVCPLFTCVNFVMTGGMITTQGDVACPTGENRLVATSKPYDTAYAYAQQHMENLTTATSVSITGGVRRDPTAAYFRGFAAESGSVVPQECFSETVTGREVNGEGVVKITGSHAQDIDLLYVDEKAKAKVEVLNTPLLPTEQGVDTNVHLGISKILPLIATKECQLELALKIPDDKTLLQKTICVQILATNDAQEVSVVFDGDVTFTRETTETPYFTVSVTCPDNGTTGTLRYSVRAYN